VDSFLDGSSITLDMLRLSRRHSLANKVPEIPASSNSFNLTELDVGDGRDVAVFVGVEHFGVSLSLLFVG
jgi:hypothetical protein